VFYLLECIRSADHKYGLDHRKDKREMKIFRATSGIAVDYMKNFLSPIDMDLDKYCEFLKILIREYKDTIFIIQYYNDEDEIIGFIIAIESRDSSHILLSEAWFTDEVSVESRDLGFSKIIQWMDGKGIDEIRCVYREEKMSDLKRWKFKVFRKVVRRKIDLTSSDPAIINDSSENERSEKEGIDE
jgi:hypothetical protein